MEALTINFYYPEIGNSGIRIPQFDIEDSIQNLRIGGTAGLLGDGGAGGVAQTTDSGRGNDGQRLRTIGEVKKAIKVCLEYRVVILRKCCSLNPPTLQKLVKSLIITCQSLGELPSK